MSAKTKYAPSGTEYGRPTASSASQSTLRCSMYRCRFASKKPSPAFSASSAAATASCSGEGVQNVMRVVAAMTGLTSRSGPIAHPIRLPDQHALRSRQRTIPSP